VLEAVELTLMASHIHDQSSAQEVLNDLRDLIELAAEKIHYKNLFEQIDTLMGIGGACSWRYDMNSRVNLVDENWKQVFGVPPENSDIDFGAYFLSRIHPDDYEQVKQAMDDYLSGRTEFYFAKFRFMSELHGEIWVEGIGISEVGSPVVYGMNRDVTRETLQRIEIEKTSTLLRSVIDHLPSGVFWKDTDSVYLGANDIFAHDTGVESHHEVVGKTDKELPLVEDEYDYFRDLDLKVIESGQSILNVPTVLHHMDAEDGWGYTSKVPLFDEQGRVYGLLGVYTDITDLKLAEQMVIDREQRLQAIFSSSSDVIILMRKDFSIEFVSPSAGSVIGVDAGVLDRTTLFKHLLDDSRLRLLETLSAFSEISALSQEGVSKRLRIDITDIKSQIHHCDLTIDRLCSEEGDTSGFLLIARDMTGQVALQNQLLRSQKMEAVGRLAAGIAHDFNNVLQGILGYSDLLQLTCERDSDAYQLTELLKTTTEEAQKLISRLFRFSKMEESTAAQLDCGQLLEKLLPTLRSALGSKAKILLDTHAPLPMIIGNSSQLEELAVSFCMFVWDAAVEKNVLHIQMDSITEPPGNVLLPDDTIRGPYLRIWFAVSAQSPNPPAAENMFDPFTTSTGSDPGLRLAFAYSIVRDHKGFITRGVSPAEEAQYLVYLPAASAENL
jgi:PAS domain S-box-containing protein